VRLRVLGPFPSELISAYGIPLRLSAEWANFYSEQLLPGGGISGRRRLGRVTARVRKGIDDLTGAGVVQLFARFVLYSVGIALQVVHMLVQLLVFLLELLHLQLKLFRLFTFVGVCGQAVMSEDDAVRHNECEGRCRDGRTTAPPQVDAILGRPCELGELGGELRFLWGDSQVRASMDSSEYLIVQ
jgi:hypothetical protein